MQIFGGDLFVWLRSQFPPRDGEGDHPQGGGGVAPKHPGAMDRLQC